MATTNYPSSGWYDGSTVTKTHSGATRKWKSQLQYSVTDNPTNVSITVSARFYLITNDATYFVKDRISTTIYVNGSNVKSVSGPSSTDNYYAGALATASYTFTINKSNTPQTRTVKAVVTVGDSSSWSGTSNVPSSGTYTINIPALDHTIYYDANGGSGTIAGQTKSYNTPVVLSDGTGFEKAHYTLIGWDTDPTATEPTYEPGETFNTNITEDMTLYAIWKMNAIAVLTKVSGEWVEGIIETKVSGEWLIPYVGYVKVGGEWIQIT